MDEKKKEKRRAIYQLIAAIVILCGFCVYLYLAFLESEATLVREKAFEKTQDIKLLCYITETMAGLDDIDNEAYGAVLQKAVEFIEREYYLTFAQLYDEDLKPYIELNEGAGGGKKHDPMEYREFVNAVTTTNDGSLSYWYETAEAGRREVHMTYLWTPSKDLGVKRYLVAIGISKHTISESLHPAVLYGGFVLVFVLATYMLGGVIAIGSVGLFEKLKKRP